MKRLIIKCVQRKEAHVKQHHRSANNKIQTPDSLPLIYCKEERGRKKEEVEKGIKGKEGEKGCGLKGR